MDELRLKVQENGDVKRLSLPQGSSTLGRDPKADIFLTDPAASREHLLLHREGDEVWAEELGSRNGTTLGGRALHGKERLAPGLRIGIGGTFLEVERLEVGRPELERVPPQRTLRFGILIACLLFLIAALTWSFLSGEGAAQASPTGVHLELAEGEGLAFGTGPEAGVKVSRLLTFDWTSPHAEGEAIAWLRFYVELAEGSQGLELALNGIAIGELLPSVQTTLRSWHLPKELIRSGASNRISFRPLKAHSDDDGPWTLWNVEVQEEPLPSCDATSCLWEAGVWIGKGREAWEAEALDPGNLFEAWSFFRRARLHLEGLDPKPDLYATTLGWIEETGSLLDLRCRKLRFTVIQSLAFEQEEQAVGAARALLQNFPSQEHPCHQRALDLLERLAPLGGE